MKKAHKKRLRKFIVFLSIVGIAGAIYYFPEQVKQSESLVRRAGSELKEAVEERLPQESRDTIRIAQVSLKNFGDTKASNPAIVDFIADRISEQALYGVCVVDELQDKDQSAFAILESAIDARAQVDIKFAVGSRVGGARKEQFGFYWNPFLVEMVGEVETLDGEIERDPAYATFNCIGSGDTFDFTLVAFHTRPDSQREELKEELEQFDSILTQIQSMDPNENDIIFIGDFNAPPEDRVGQSVSIRESMPIHGDNIVFTITSEPTNFNRKKIYDNLFFLKSETTEFVEGSGKVVHLSLMEHEYEGKIPAGNTFENWFYRNVLDHSPVYGEFWVLVDSD